MRTDAGRLQAKEKVYVDARPGTDRTPAPADEVARFMAVNLFYCQLLTARISERQCEVNRSKDLYLCGKCDQAALAAPVVKKPKTISDGRRKLRRPTAPAGQHEAVSKSPWREQIYNRVELARHEAAQADTPAHSEPSDQAAETCTEPQKTAQVRSGQVRSGQVRSGQVRSGQVRSGQVRSRRALTGMCSKSCR